MCDTECTACGIMHSLAVEVGWADEGFLMQKLSGSGIAFVEIDGIAMERHLLQESACG